MSLHFSYISSEEQCKKEKDNYSINYYREIDVNTNATDPNRNYEIENRIKLIEKQNNDRCINLYGGMGLDSVSNDIKLLRLEELKYMIKNPQLYQYKQKDDNI